MGRKRGDVWVSDAQARVFDKELYWPGLKPVFSDNWRREIKTKIRLHTAVAIVIIMS